VLVDAENVKPKEWFRVGEHLCEIHRSLKGTDGRPLQVAADKHGSGSDFLSVLGEVNLEYNVSQAKPKAPHTSAQLPDFVVVLTYRFFRSVTV
jgi:hypothetical protein